MAKECHCYRLAGIVLIALTLTGCAAAIPLGLVFDGASTAVSTWQGRKARQAMEAQTAEIKALREEIQRLRERMR